MIGWSPWPWSCDRIAPMAKLDALVVTVNGNSLLGMHRTGASVIHFLSLVKASDA